MVVINPEECIDCGVCESECPANAIKSDIEDGMEPMEPWVEHNQKYSQIWPNITHNFPQLPEAEKWDEVENKLKTCFSEKPGNGD